MRRSFVLGSPFLAALALASNAAATTLYVSPTGTVTAPCCTTRDAPCDLASAANAAQAGDTVVLMDGVYKTALYVQNSGTSSAWITFQADECATPIIEGPGVGPAEDNQDGGVSSTTAAYVRFVGLVSRGWSTGFGNGWTGNKAQDSNGNWEIVNCVADGNGRTGFTFFSATGFHLKNSIAAHNGSSTMHSWSSGVTIYSSTPGINVEGNVSFENMDAEKHTDGSGFIVDEGSHGASFVNNIAFRNGGSCLRMTKSNSTKFINNTCYHDAQDSADTGPDDPDELYFTNAPSDMTTITTISFTNNALVALGSGHGLKTSNYTPTSGWSNNVTATGTVTYFTGAEGNNSDFTLASGATTLIGKGATGTGVPTNDAGFDPKCVVKRAPTPIGMMATGSWWQYSVDIDYIKSIGGVAKCFNAKTRSGTPDIGAYANGAVTTSPAGACMAPAATGTGGMSADPSCSAGMGAGGMATSGGSAGAGTAGSGVGVGGTANVGGMSSAGSTATGVGGSTTGAGGAATGVGGSATSGAGTGTSGSPSGMTGGTTATGSGGTTTGTGGSSGGRAPAAGGATGAATGAAGSGASSPSSCGCRVAGESSRGASLAGFGLLGLGLVGLRRRRQARR